MHPVGQNQINQKNNDNSNEIMRKITLFLNKCNNIYKYNSTDKNQLYQLQTTINHNLNLNDSYYLENNIKICS